MTPLIRQAKNSDLEAIAALAATQQADPEHHVAFLGMDAENISTDIAELGEWHETSTVAEHDGAIVGALIADIDPEMGRLWWFGPFVCLAPWEQIADDLYAHARSLIQPHIAEEEAFCDARSDVLGEWCHRHQFVRNEGSVLLNLQPGTDMTSHDGVRPLGLDDHAAVRSLHDAAFPGTHTTAAALLASANPKAVIDADGQVAGYVAYEVQPDNSGYIDYLAVDPQHRGAGFGQALVSHASADLFARGVSHVHLSVREGSHAARALYARVGFGEERVAIPYRKGFTLDS